MQNLVDNMLEHLWTRDRALLIDMTDDKHRNIQRFCCPHQEVGTFPHLCDAARRGAQLCEVHGLDGVDHDQIGFEILDLLADDFHIGFCHNKQVFGINLQTNRA